MKQLKTQRSSLGAKFYMEKHFHRSKMSKGNRQKRGKCLKFEATRTEQVHKVRSLGNKQNTNTQFQTKLWQHEQWAYKRAHRTDAGRALCVSHRERKHTKTLHGLHIHAMTKRRCTFRLWEKFAAVRLSHAQLPHIRVLKLMLPFPRLCSNNRCTARQ